MRDLDSTNVEAAAYLAREHLNPPWADRTPRRPAKSSEGGWVVAPTVGPYGLRWFAWRDLPGTAEEFDGELFVTRDEADARAADLNAATVVSTGVSRCGRLLVGRGGDTHDPLCALPAGHGGMCRPMEDLDG